MISPSIHRRHLSISLFRKKNIATAQTTIIPATLAAMGTIRPVRVFEEMCAYKDEEVGDVGAETVGVKPLANGGAIVGAD